MQSKWAVPKRKGLSSSPAPKAQTQIDGRNPSKHWPQERKSFWKERSESVEKLPQRQVHEPVVLFLAYSRMSKLQITTGMQSRRNVRLTGSPVKSRRKVVGKVLLPYWKIPSNSYAYSRIQSRRKRKETKTLGTQAQRAIPRMYVTPHKNSGKEGSIRRCYSAL